MNTTQYRFALDIHGELEEVPAPGTSPEAPDGPAYVAPADEEENDDTDEEEDRHASEDEVTPFRFPSKDDDNLL